MPVVGVFIDETIGLNGVPSYEKIDKIKQSCQKRRNSKVTLCGSGMKYK